MSDLNIQMLIKLLRMTESQHEGEALSAMRMANSLLNKHNANWDEVMRGVVPMVDADPFKSAPKPGAPPAVKYSDKVEIDTYFATLCSRDLGTFKDYVDDVHKWWTEKGFLTQKQYDVIKKSAQRTRR